jgi:hypothetical protein
MNIVACGAEAWATGSVDEKKLWTSKIALMRTDFFTQLDQKRK